MCGYAEDRTPPLSGSGARPLLAKRDPFCALQACLKVRLFRLSRWSRCRFLMSVSYTEQALAHPVLLSYWMQRRCLPLVGSEVVFWFVTQLHGPLHLMSHTNRVRETCTEHARRRLVSLTLE